MKLTPVRKNIIRLLKQSVDRAFARHAARRRKVSLTDPRMWKDAPCGPDIDRMFPYFSGLHDKPASFAHLPDSDIRAMLNVIVRYCYTGDRERRNFEKELIDDLREHAAEYELLSQMPPPKREYKRRGPRSLVERRADTVDEKVREWERKLKLAKTKLAMYKKKQKYYQKKGTVTA
jgi:hypothetical protein